METVEESSILKTHHMLDYMSISMKYTYQFSSGSVNSLVLRLKGKIGTETPRSTRIEIPLGEWVALGLYFTPPNHYSLRIENYGEVSLTAS